MENIGYCENIFQLTSDVRMQSPLIALVALLNIKGINIMRTWIILVLLIVLASGAIVSAQVSVIMSPPTPGVFHYPVQNGTKLMVTVIGETATGNSIMLGNTSLSIGIPLSTTLVDWRTLSATLPVTSPKGVYRVWVHNANGNSNEWNVIVGTGAKTRVCAGGLLSFNSTVEQVNLYMASFDTLNCKFIQPPPGLLK